MGNGIIFYKERQQLLMECSIAFLEYIREMGRAPGSIYEPLAIYRVPFLPRSTLKLHTKYQILGTLSA